MNKQEIIQWCNQRSNEHLQLLKTLAAIPAPSYREHARVEFIRKWLEAAGATQATVDPALNILLPFGCEGRSDIRVYMAHTDVVFPDVEPLPVREEGGGGFMHRGCAIIPQMLLR